MPGYGVSDPLPGETLTIEALVENLAFMDALGIQQCGVYGFHTGASIANALARRHPQRVSVSVLNGLLCLTGTEREEFLSNYTPAFVPQWDGGHLAWLWSRIKDQSLYFPWYRRTPAARLSMQGTEPESMHAAVLDWLRAGEHYQAAYIAAFRYSAELDLPHITTPHFILGVAHDPLRAHLQRLPALPNDCRIEQYEDARSALDRVCRLLSDFPAASTVPPPAAARQRVGRTWADYITVSGMQLRVLRTEARNAPALLFLHDAQSSARCCAAMQEKLSKGHTVLALELPGHGESDALPEKGDYAIETLAQLAHDALQVIGVDEVALVGIGAGASILTALATHAPVPVKQLSLDSLVDFEAAPAQKARPQAAYAADVVPDFFGGHLLRAWHETRDQLLYFPWFERSPDTTAPHAAQLTTHSLHARTVANLIAGPAGYAVRRAEMNHPLAQNLRLVNAPFSIAASRTDPRFHYANQLAQSVGRECVDAALQA